MTGALARSRLHACRSPLSKGTPVQQPRNIAASVGRWSARHRKTAILGWLAFVVLAFFIGGKIGTNTLTTEQNGVGDSGRATKIYAEAYPDKLDESVMIQGKALSADDPEFKAAVADVTRRLEAAKGVTAIAGPYDSKAAAPISKDGHSALGSLPVTLILLLLAFGTLVAAGIPLLLAITGVIATLGLVGPLSQLAPVDDSIKHVILLIGLAVGVDYSLFYLRRAREERAAGTRLPSRRPPQPPGVPCSSPASRS